MREDKSCRKEDVFVGPRVTSCDSKMVFPFSFVKKERTASQLNEVSLQRAMQSLHGTRRVGFWTMTTPHFSLLLRALIVFRKLSEF
jgi:hypothetical protein